MGANRPQVLVYFHPWFFGYMPRGIVCEGGESCPLYDNEEGYLGAFCLGYEDRATCADNLLTLYDELDMQLSAANREWKQCAQGAGEWFVDEPDFPCGWVSPDGHTFSCSDCGHEPLARYLLLHVVNGVHTGHAQKMLLQAGWVMVFADGELLSLQAMTPEQKLLLNERTAG